MSNNNNRQNNANTNKVRLTSIKHKENEKGSLVSSLYYGAQDAVDLINQVTEALEASEGRGIKITLMTIPGQDYDSGYMYVNPKEAPRAMAGGNGGGQQRYSKYNNNKSQTNSFGQNKTKSFLKSKQVVGQDGQENS